MILTRKHEVETIRDQLCPNESEARLAMLKPNPWEDSDVEDKYLVGSVVSGTVTSITDYGVFLKLEEGITGMVHKSELSVATKRHNSIRFQSR